MGVLSAMLVKGPYSMAASFKGLSALIQFIAVPDLSARQGLHPTLTISRKNEDYMDSVWRLGF